MILMLQTLAKPPASFTALSSFALHLAFVPEFGFCCLLVLFAT